jgi:hypothetical protein
VSLDVVELSADVDEPKFDPGFVLAEFDELSTFQFGTLAASFDGAHAIWFEEAELDWFV